MSYPPPTAHVPPVCCHYPRCVPNALVWMLGEDKFVCVETPPNPTGINSTSVIGHVAQDVVHSMTHWCVVGH